MMCCFTSNHSDPTEILSKTPKLPKTSKLLKSTSKASKFYYYSPKFNFDPSQRIRPPTNLNNQSGTASHLFSPSPELVSYEMLENERKLHSKTKKKLYKMEEKYQNLKHETFKWQSFSKNLQRDLLYLQNEIEVLKASTLRTNSKTTTSNNSSNHQTLLISREKINSTEGTSSNFNTLQQKKILPRVETICPEDFLPYDFRPPTSTKLDQMSKNLQKLTTQVSQAKIPSIGETKYSLPTQTIFKNTQKQKNLKIARLKQQSNTCTHIKSTSINSPIQKRVQIRKSKSARDSKFFSKFRLNVDSMMNEKFNEITNMTESSSNEDLRKNLPKKCRSFSKIKTQKENNVVPATDIMVDSAKAANPVIPVYSTANRLTRLNFSFDASIQKVLCLEEQMKMISASSSGYNSHDCMLNKLAQTGKVSKVQKYFPKALK